MPTIFISYSHKDKRWKDRLVSHLGVSQQQGVLELWDDRKIGGGEDWHKAILEAINAGSIAVLLISPDFLNSEFILREEVPRLLRKRNLNRMRIFPIIIRPVDWEAVGWLKKMNLRPEDGRPVGSTKKIDADLADIAREIRLYLNRDTASTTSSMIAQPTRKGGRTKPQKPKPEPICPYLGLNAFRETDSRFFFGRGEFTKDILTKTRHFPLVAVVGPSGCGKSSVVQAGLLPRLRSESTPWKALIVQPKENPFHSLAVAFVSLWMPEADSVTQFTRRDDLADSLRKEGAIRRALGYTFEKLEKNSRLLIVVDQFEELFTLSEGKDRKPFINSLLMAAQTSPITIVLTLRADFYGQAIDLTPELSKRIQEGIVNHRRMTRDDLKAVIVKPAEQVGFTVNPALVELILSEVEAQPDSLPLLEYALKELWRGKRTDEISLEEYEEIGRVEGAINKKADEVLAQLRPERQDLALQALTRLVQVSISDEGGAYIRRRVGRDELTDEKRDVLQQFVEEHLLVTNINQITNKETIEVAHEALIRRWGKLREALDKDREFLLWQRRLNFRLKEWEDADRNEGGLLQGLFLEEAKRWLKERGQDLTVSEKEFITWTERDNYHIEQILSKAPGVALYSEGKTLRDWFFTLGVCTSGDEALHIVQDIKDMGARARSLGIITEALVEVGRRAEAQQAASEALQAAREIVEAGDRAQALNGAIGVLIKAAKLAEAQQAAGEALQAAREIKVKKNRAQALNAVVGTLAEMGKPAEAQQAASEALQAAREIVEADDRARALNAVVGALVEVGKPAEAQQAASEALQAAREIEDPYARAQALSGAIGVLIKAGKSDDALLALREIEDAQARTQALNAVIGVLIKAGKSDEALKAARKVVEADDRAQALNAVAGALVEVGKPAEAQQAASEALQAARGIVEADYRAQALNAVVGALVEVGKPAEAQQAASEALQAAREIEDPSARAQALNGAIGVLTKADKSAEAQQAAGEALQAAREIKVKKNRAQALNAVVGALVEVGKPAEALQAAREIEDPYARAQALNGAIGVLTKAGKSAEAQQAASEALQAAREIIDAGYRAQALNAVVGALVEVGKPAEAQQGASEALQAAREIEDPYARAQALLIIIRFLLNSNLSERVMDIVGEIHDALRNIYDEVKRSATLSPLAEVLAKLRSYSKAREIADQCSKSSDRLAAYTAILREYTIEHNPNLAEFSMSRSLNN